MKFIVITVVIIAEILERKRRHLECKKCTDDVLCICVVYNLTHVSINICVPDLDYCYRIFIKE